MKNLYRPDDRKGVRRLLAATVLLVAIFAADLVSGGVLRDMARAAGARAFSFASGASAAVAGSGIFSSRRALVSENEALKYEITELRVRAAGAVALEEELKALRPLLRLAEATPGTTAPIVSSFAASPYGTFLIGAGTGAGIAAGDLALIAEGESEYVLGIVSEPSAARSLVTHVFAPLSEIQGRVSEADILVEGRGGSGRAEVPASLAVSEGDVVTAAQFGGRPIGIVAGIEEESGSASKELLIGFPVSFSSIRFVYVVPR